MHMDYNGLIAELERIDNIKETNPCYFCTGDLEHRCDSDHCLNKYYA